MFSLIPNYNLIQLHDHFKVSYNEIAAGLKISGSSVSNWGGTMCVPIPDTYWEPVAAKFGYTKYEFGTTILNASEFKKKSFVNTKTEPKKSSVPKSVIAKKDDLCDTDFTSSTDSTEIVESSSNQINTVKAVTIESKLNTSAAQIIITSERIQKMYNSLTSTNLNEVNQLIADLFFSQL